MSMATSSKTLPDPTPRAELEPPPTPGAGLRRKPVLDIRNLSISFFTRAGEIPAVMDFSTEVMPGV